MAARIPHLLLAAVNRILRPAGLKLKIIRRAALQPPRTRHTGVWERVGPFTMTDVPRIEALYDSAVQIHQNGIPGDFVECGVYRGGASMTMALALLAAGGLERDIWLFDTFEGMTAPTEHDIRLKDGSSAAEKFEALRTGDNSADWCAASLDEVADNMRSTGYPMERIRLIKGPVESTLLGDLPERIALLRLDTDWYESTRVEMERLFPRISPGGVLIIDDYNHWAGARRAVDEYLDHRGIKLMFFPIGGGSVMTVI